MGGFVARTPTEGSQLRGRGLCASLAHRRRRPPGGGAGLPDPAGRGHRRRRPRREHAPRVRRGHGPGRGGRGDHRRPAAEAGRADLRLHRGRGRRAALRHRLPPGRGGPRRPRALRAEAARRGAAGLAGGGPAGRGGLARRQDHGRRPHPGPGRLRAGAAHGRLAGDGRVRGPGGGRRGDAGHHPAPGPQGPRLLPGPAQRRPPGPGRDLERPDVRRPRAGRAGRPLPAVRRRGQAPGERAVIQSVGRAARILKALGSESARLGVTELAERLGLAKATVYGLLRTLEAHQLVEQDIETGKYRLGPALLQLGNAFLDNNELRAREAVHVGVLYGPNLLLVHHVFRPDNSLQILQVGASIPWHACALGKATVAYLDPDARAELLAGPLPRLTGRTMTTRELLEAELEAVVASGVAVEDQEAIVGEAGIAAALFDNRGAVVGAIGLAGPVERMLADGPASEMVAAVKEAARGLSRELGAGRPAVPRAGA